MGLQPFCYWCCSSLIHWLSSSFHPAYYPFIALAMLGLLKPAYFLFSLSPVICSPAHICFIFSSLLVFPIFFHVLILGPSFPFLHPGWTLGLGIRPQMSSYSTPLFICASQRRELEPFLLVSHSA